MCECRPWSLWSCNSRPSANGTLASSVKTSDATTAVLQVELTLSLLIAFVAGTIGPNKVSVYAKSGVDVNPIDLAVPRVTKR